MAKADITISCHADPPIGVEISGTIYPIDPVSRKRLDAVGKGSVRPTHRCDVGELVRGTEYDFEFSITTWSNQVGIILYALELAVNPDRMLSKKRFDISKPSRHRDRVFTFTV